MPPSNVPPSSVPGSRSSALPVLLAGARTVRRPGMLLRPWEPADAPVVAAAAADDLIARWNPLLPPGPDRLERAEQWCRRQAEDADDAVSWAVCVGEGPVLPVAGYVSLYRIDVLQANAQAGYWTAPQARGRGVATRALLAGRAVAFDVLGLQRLGLFHAVENEGSCRVAEAAGLPREGVHRLAYRYGDGELHDEHSHAVLARDPLPRA